jgi:hypothetical protein
MDNKIKHIEVIQGVINRMAVNSFYIKGWCITLVAALFALSAKDANIKYIIIAFLPVPIFWILDGYYLWQERLFRALYDKVRTSPEEAIDFSMDTRSFVGKEKTWIATIFSKTLLLFYFPLIVIMLIIMLIIN